MRRRARMAGSERAAKAVDDEIGQCLDRFIPPAVHGPATFQLYTVIRNSLGRKSKVTPSAAWFHDTCNRVHTKISGAVRGKKRVAVTSNRGAFS
jgi:hypothetical protein